MMIDSLLEFSDAQALTATAVSTNVVDLTSDRDVGPGRTVWVVLTIDVAPDSASADETYTVDLETDDNESFTSATQLWQYTIIRTAAQGAPFALAVPMDNERFLRLNYTLGGTTPTITVSAHLTDQEPFEHLTYPDAVN